MSAAQNRQLDAWRGEFGDSYIARNGATAEVMRDRTRMWTRIFERLPLGTPSSILEIGCNIGVNLRALAGITAAELGAVEPNARARAQVVADGVLPPSRIHEASVTALPFADGAFDLAFTSGVLIHVPPNDLPAAIDEIVRVAKRYIVCAEYFATNPEQRTYRGEEGLLFKRDFGGLYLDRHPELKLLDHGFFWRRATGIDDLVWQLFEKP